MPETVFLGKVIMELDSVVSTNEYAADLTEKSPWMEGTVIRADHQSGGKGYSGNSWESERGKNLVISIMLKPSFLLPKNQFFLTQAISLAVRESVQEFAGKNEVKIKWPNDIICDDKKIAGILIENAVQGHMIQHSIIGIGLNINQSLFSPGLKCATSLKLITGKDHDLKSVLDILCEKIEYRFLQLKNGHIEKIQKDYMKDLYRVEEDSIYLASDKKFHAKIMGLTATGKLVLQVGDRHEVFGFKEVEMVM